MKSFKDYEKNDKTQGATAEELTKKIASAPNLKVKSKHFQTNLKIHANFPQ